MLKKIEDNLVGIAGAILIIPVLIFCFGFLTENASSISRVVVFIISFIGSSNSICSLIFSDASVIFQMIPRTNLTARANARATSGQYRAGITNTATNKITINSAQLIPNIFNHRNRRHHWC